MKKLFALLLIALSTQAGWSATINGGQGVGSGGDALRQLFDEAALAAQGRLEALDWCNFSNSTDPVLAKWILDQRGSFLGEVQNSVRNWVVDSQPTCGYTDHSNLAPIYFSYPTCAATVGNDLNLALFTLLQECSHHLGVNDEKQADAAAQAIMSANINQSCPAPVADPFDASICQGPVFSASDAARYITPGSSSADIGNYKVYARTRQCNHLNGCAPWKPDSLVFFNGNTWAPQGNPSLSLRTLVTAPFYSVFLDLKFDRVGSVNFAEGTPGSLPVSNSPAFTTATIVQQTRSTPAKTASRGEVRENCGWFDVHQTSWDNGAGIYYESEFVIYGTQKP